MCDKPLCFDGPELLLNHLKQVQQEKLREVQSFFSGLSSRSMMRLADGRGYLLGDEFLHPSLQEIRTNLNCLVFRGHFDQKWDLIDNASRPSNKQSLEYNHALSFLRCTAFRNVIASSEYWKKMTLGHVNGEAYNFLDDNRFLAQHYDIPTTLLDYTMDPEVAMYFACTRYDPKTKTTRPLCKEDLDKSKYGQLFQSSYCHENSGNPFTIIPVQLALRPSKQKGFMRDLRNDCSIQQTKYQFKHDLDFSKRLWEQYGGEQFMKSGKDSALLKISSIICSQNEFSQSLVDKAINSMNLKPDTIDELQTNLTITKDDPIWYRKLIEQSKSLKLDYDKQPYEELCKKLRNPMTFDAATYYEFLSSLYSNELNAKDQKTIRDRQSLERLDYISTHHK